MFKTFFFLFLMLLCCQNIFGQQPASPTKAEGPSLTPTHLQEADSVIITVLLKHQQDKNLAEIRRKLEANGFWDLFPPKDARVISWNIAMGLGHIIVLKLPANSIRRLHLSIENGAWGAFSSEIYVTYDYFPIWHDFVEQRNEAREDRN